MRKMSLEMTRHEQALRDAVKSLVGKTVVEARYMTAAERESQDWGQSGIIIIFDDGTQLVPMSDGEGNMPGSVSLCEEQRTITLSPLYR